MSLSATLWESPSKTMSPLLPLQVPSLLQVLIFVITLVGNLLLLILLEVFNDFRLPIVAMSPLISIVVSVQTLFLLTMSAKAKPLEVLRKPLLLAVVFHYQLILTPFLVLLFLFLPLFQVDTRTKIFKRLQGHIWRQSEP